MNWSEYQEKASKFFTKLGLETKIEYELEGVRGVHVIDVYATGNYNGIKFSWVIECKAWKTNIPKEKVMALTSIVQDVGADRGFLLSEVGFQSGAIRAAKTSNITLTSLQDLSFTSEKYSIDALIGSKNIEIEQAKRRLLKMKRKSERHEYNIERTMLFGELGVIQILLDDALENHFPALYPTKGLVFNTLSQIIDYANEYIEKANLWELE